MGLSFRDEESPLVDRVESLHFVSIDSNPIPETENIGDQERLGRNSEDVVIQLSADSDMPRDIDIHVSG